MKYHNIKFDHNSDCWGELEALKALLRGNKQYAFEDFSYAQIVSIAVDELHDKLIAEKKNGVNQRSV